MGSALGEKRGITRTEGPTQCLPLGVFDDTTGENFLPAARGWQMKRESSAGCRVNHDHRAIRPHRMSDGCVEVRSGNLEGAPQVSAVAALLLREKPDIRQGFCVCSKGRTREGRADKCLDEDFVARRGG